MRRATTAATDPSGDPWLAAAALPGERPPGWEQAPEGRVLQVCPRLAAEDVGPGRPRRLETHAEGFGDFELSLLYQTWRNANASVHLNLGISLPSGSIIMPMRMTPKVSFPFELMGM